MDPFVIKRDGSRAPMNMQKVSDRIHRIALDMQLFYDRYYPKEYPYRHMQIEVLTLAKKTVNNIRIGIKTSEIDASCAHECSRMILKHPSYDRLAGALLIDNAFKSSGATTLRAYAELAYNYVHPKAGKNPLIREDVYRFILENEDRLESVIGRISNRKDTTVLFERNLLFDYASAHMLIENQYLLRLEEMNDDGKLVTRVFENPQFMFMRVAIGIHGPNLDDVLTHYDLLSRKQMCMATPIMLYAGTPAFSVISCFLVSTFGDSIRGIYDTLTSVAGISQKAGGVGVNVTKVRPKGSYIRGSNGASNGLVPMLRVFNNTARYVDQGGGKRKGAFAIYLEPWHGDLVEWLDLKKFTGDAESRATDLNYALMMPDVFFERLEHLVLTGEDMGWTLFDSSVVPELEYLYGQRFTDVYCKYENTGHGVVARHDIRVIWDKIASALKQTGQPYILSKCSVNRKTNHSNLFDLAKIPEHVSQTLQSLGKDEYASITMSNLCAEIVQYTNPGEVCDDDREIAACNLGSIPVNAFVIYNDGKNTYDFESLMKASAFLTKCLNNVIDRNQYPNDASRSSNARHRPIGIGIQGLADLFCLLGYKYRSKDARLLAADVAEAIYFSALQSSCELAQRDGAYSTFSGSHFSHGRFQHDLWNKKPSKRLRLDWDNLRSDVMEHGVRNSLLTAHMPTKSTACVLGNTQSFEPFSGAFERQRRQNSELTVINKYLVHDLIRIGIWRPSLRSKITEKEGSVSGITEIPKEIRDMYESKIDMDFKPKLRIVAAMAPFVDQSQSYNVYFLDNVDALTNVLTHMMIAWKSGLKTLRYYTTVPAETLTLAARSIVRNDIVSPSSVTESSSEGGRVCSLAGGGCCDG